MSSLYFQKTLDKIHYLFFNKRVATNFGLGTKTHYQFNLIWMVNVMPSLQDLATLKKYYDFPQGTVLYTKKTLEDKINKNVENTLEAYFNKPYLDRRNQILLLIVLYSYLTPFSSSVSYFYSNSKKKKKMEIKKSLSCLLLVIIPWYYSRETYYSQTSPLLISKKWYLPTSTKWFIPTNILWFLSAGRNLQKRSKELKMTVSTYHLRILRFFQYLYCHPYPY